MAKKRKTARKTKSRNIGVKGFRGKRPPDDPVRLASFQDVIHSMRVKRGQPRGQHVPLPRILPPDLGLQPPQMAFEDTFSAADCLAEKPPRTRAEVVAEIDAQRRRPRVTPPYSQDGVADSLWRVLAERAVVAFEAYVAFIVPKKRIKKRTKSQPKRKSHARKSHLARAAVTAGGRRLDRPRQRR